MRSNRNSEAGRGQKNSSRETPFPGPPGAGGRGLGLFCKEQKQPRAPLFPPPSLGLRDVGDGDRCQIVGRDR